MAAVPKSPVCVLSCKDIDGGPVMIKTKESAHDSLLCCMFTPPRLKVQNSTKQILHVVIEGK